MHLYASFFNESFGAALESVNSGMLKFLTKSCVHAKLLSVAHFHECVCLGMCGRVCGRDGSSNFEKLDIYHEVSAFTMKSIKYPSGTDE